MKPKCLKKHHCILINMTTILNWSSQFLSILVSDHPSILLRQYFLGRKLEDDGPLEELLKVSNQPVSVQHLIYKRIFEPWNELVHDPDKTSFPIGIKERSNFLSCSKSVFSYDLHKEKAGGSRKKYSVVYRSTQQRITKLTC